MSYTLLIVFALTAIGVSFLCSILEAVLLSIPKSSVAVMEASNKKYAAKWRAFKSDPERPLTAILTLNTIAHTVGALGVGTEVAKLYATSSNLDVIMGVASAILTLGVLLFSEILPKTIGTLYAKQLAGSTAFILQILIYSLIWIVAPIEWMRRIFPAAVHETVTREELVALVDVAEEERTIETDEESVIHNLLKLKDIKVRDVMTPRVVLNAVEQAQTVNEVLAEKPIMVHGRMPVHGGSIDDVLGLVLRSEILRRAADDEFNLTMKELMRPIHQVNPEHSVVDALNKLLDYKEQILVVKDEFGGTTGIITIEDIIETLLGREIIDESDMQGIEEGVVAEDMREFAKQKVEENGGNFS